MSFKYDSLTSSSKKAPPFDPENFTFWSTLFQAYVGKAEWALFEEPKPELDENAYEQTLGEGGAQTEQSQAMEKAVKNQFKNGRKTRTRFINIWLKHAATQKHYACKQLSILNYLVLSFTAL